MNAREKRSNGGYGLRRKVAKKRLDEDFEYYFSKIGNPWDSKGVCVEEDSDDERAKVHAHLLVVDVMKSAIKGELPEKRPRGRPRKIQIGFQDRDPDISDANLKFVDLKAKRIRKPKVMHIDDETSKAVHEICAKDLEMVTVGHEEVIQDETNVSKRLKLETVLGDEITTLQEEEVTSLPEGEKENLPEDGVRLDSDLEEAVIVQMGVDVQSESGEVDGELYEVGEDIEKGCVPKMKQKHRRNRLSHDTIRKLSQLSPDDKIECNECHKLLKPSSFRQHLRTHTGEKPFGCHVCDARFTRKGDVERHVRIVHNKQKPFKCSRCQRAFGDKKNLRWHILNHNKKLFYVCEACGFKFGKREYWENHVRFIHPLPGGLDPSEVVDMDSEENLQALSESLLGDEELVLVSSDRNGASSIIKTEPLLNYEESPTCKPKSLKSVNLKCVSSLMKIARPTGINSSSHVLMQNQADGMGTVVIQFNESGVASSTSNSQDSSAANMVHLMNSGQVLQLVQDEVTSSKQQPIVIDTQNYEVVASGEEETLEPEVQISEGDPKISVVEFIDAEPNKVISIMMNNEQGTGTIAKNVNAHTLIEALLDAAKDDKKSGQTTNEST